MSVTALHPFTIGGSEAAAACGVDPFLSPVMLWAYKTGRAERPETEAMHFGKLLERLVWGELEERGYDLLPAPAEGFADDERKWLIGHPDGFVPDGVLEIKTANQWAHRAGWNGDVPVQYQAQAQVYMHLTKRERTTLACLVGGSRLEVRTIERDEDAIGLLLAGMERFHRHLRRDKMPAADGSDSARAALLLLYPEGGFGPGARGTKVVRLDREGWQDDRELRARKEQRDVIDRQIQELENRYKARIGDAELAISPHDTDAARWSNVQARRLDQTRLKAERPEIAEEFTTVTTTRRFTLL